MSEFVGCQIIAFPVLIDFLIIKDQNGTMLEGGGLSKSEQAEAKSFLYAVMTRRIPLDVPSSEGPHVAFKAGENLGSDQTALIFQLCSPFLFQSRNIFKHIFVRFFFHWSAQRRSLISSFV